ncbi:hypothetical protein GCM10010964_23990 [Caldovatus sediminis]|uniref:DUF1285 domain-containing protein n=1 Tax=Caldovatus sediminis TaxID=2041189 RepID=A0A8J2ZB99_9PROT|nr:DUF1285 domain-containing protein [Caldovatus sediminis]GGG35326.1 hypothetical protein GCM10010964_23990 [Caldovatus sediminis]
MNDGATIMTAGQQAASPPLVAVGPPGPARRGPARQRHDHGTFAIRIARDGTWHYRGSPIQRKELVCLFASVLKREADGSYVLETPAERGRIEVEDAPFVAVEMWWRECDGRSCLTFRTNLDEMITADADHPIRVAIDPQSREPRPYVTVRPGLEARISRPVYYEMVALARPERMADGREVLGVWSEGVFFPIDEVPPGEAGATEAVPVGATAVAAQ